MLPVLLFLRTSLMVLAEGKVTFTTPVLLLESAVVAIVAEVLLLAGASWLDSIPPVVEEEEEMDAERCDDCGRLA